MKKLFAVVVLILLGAAWLMAPAIMEWSDHETVYSDTWKIEKDWVVMWAGLVLVWALLIWAIKTLKS